MTKGAYSSLAVKHYFQATENVADLLASYFKVSFPADYIKYKKAFDAGMWLDEDPGPWLGCAIVYKLDVNPHVDQADGGPTAIFNVGRYSGGELYLPCIGLKFQ